MRPQVNRPIVVLAAVELLTIVSGYCADVTSSGKRHFFSKEGEVAIGGLFSLSKTRVGQKAGSSSPRSCSANIRPAHVYEYVQPLVYVVNHLHQRRLSAGEHNVSLGYTIADTCNSDYVATNATLQLGAVAKRVGLCRSSGGPAQTCSADQPARGVLMAVGPGESSMVKAAANLLQTLGVPAVSPSATSDDFTNNMPYFFRTCPPDSHQAEAIADILKHFGWNYVIALSSADFSYGRSGLRLFLKEAGEKNICVSYSRSFSEDDGPLIKEIVDVLYERHEARAVVLFSGSAPAGALFQEIARRRRKADASQRRRYDKIWIGSDGWGSSKDIIFDDRFTDVLTTSLVLFPQIPDNLEWFLEELVDGFIDYFAGLTTQEVRRQTDDPWLCVFWEDMLKCNDACDDNYPNRPNVTQSCDDLYPEKSELRERLSWAKQTLLSAEIAFRVLDSLWKEVVATSKLSHLQLLQEFFRQATGKRLADLLHDLTVPCSTAASKNCRVFDEGFQTVPAYTISTQSDKKLKTYTKVGLWSHTKKSRQNKHGAKLEVNEMIVKWRDGFVTNCTVEDNNSARVVYASPSTCTPDCPDGSVPRRLIASPCGCWSCIRCSNGIAIDRLTYVDLCPSQDQNISTASQCKIVLLYFGKDLTDSRSLAVIAISAVGISLSVATLVVFRLKRTWAIIKSSDVRLSALLLVSMIGGYILALTLSLKPTQTQCYFVRLCLTPFYVLVTATLLVKTSRMARLVLAAHRLKFMRTWTLEHGAQLLFISILVAIGSILDTISVFVWPPKTEKVDLGDNKENLICAFYMQPHLITDIYISALVIITSVFAFITRKLPGCFNEARFIFFAAFSSVVLWIVISFAYYLASSQTRPLLGCLRLQAYLLLVWLGIFMQKLFVVFFRPERAARTMSVRSVPALTGSMYRIQSTPSVVTS